MSGPLRASGWRGSSGVQGENLSPAAMVSNVGVPMGYRQVGGVSQGQHVVMPQTDGVPGKRVSRASGNPDVYTRAAVDPQQTPYGGGDQSLSQFGRPRVLGVGQETSWRGGSQFANDKLEARDRHGILKVGTERGGGRDSGQTDPPMDGPPRPSLWLIQRSITWQQGTDTTAHQDQLPGENRPYTRVQAAPIREAMPGMSWTSRYRKYDTGDQWVGEQGTGWTPVNGGVPGLWQPYGSYAGVCNGPVQGIQSPVAQGSPGDGPQKVWSGPPHGLHSNTYPDYSSTLGRYMAIPQMAAPRIDRPANSTSNGQSYSQFVQPQGQTGTAAVVFNQNQGIAGVPAVGSAWRGQIPGNAGKRTT